MTRVVAGTLEKYGVVEAKQGRGEMDGLLPRSRIKLGVKEIHWLHSMNVIGDGSWTDYEGITGQVARWVWLKEWVEDDKLGLEQHVKDGW